MARLRFTKMHGLGNDFIVIDAIRQPFSPEPALIQRLADRHYGIGCDQLLMVEPARGAGADFRYRIFNADGGEVAQCGNGARCFARFVREKGLSERSDLRVETDAGVLLLRYHSDDRITVDMGVPRHAPEQIPLLAVPEARSYQVGVEGGKVDFGACSLGNPHAVLLVTDLDLAPVQTLGPELEMHPAFPMRANIGFAQPLDRHYLRLRVWERGAGETLACGSGACAAVVVGIEQGWLESPAEVELPGGTLQISWAGRGEPVLLCGPATTVFEGEIEL